MEIQIYKAEQDIAELVRKSNSISHIVEVKEVQPFGLTEKLQASIQKSPERSNFDLHYIESLLVTSSINGNDEYFSPYELWAARHTAKDKPFNIEHTCDDIIGHMTNSYAINDEGKTIAEDSTLDSLPDLLHIVSQAVVYKYWKDEAKQERMDQLLGELKDNKWFVSVECLFPNFDYLLRSDNGQVKLITRNEKTAFLTKYLRVYGGVGVYDNQKICRVPRNLILSGKGLVKQPANKNSIIFSKKYEVSKNNLETVYKVTEVIKMDNAKEVQYQETIKKLEGDMLSLKASLDEGKNKDLQVKLDGALKINEVSLQEINALKASALTLSTEKSELVKSLDTLKAEKKLAEDKIQKIEADQKYATRINTCKAELGMDDEKAKAFSDSLSLLPDKNFADLIQFNKQFIQVAASTTLETKVTPDVKALDNTEKVKDASLTVVTTPAPTAKETTMKLAASLAEYMNKTNPQANSKAKFAVEVK